MITLHPADMCPQCRESLHFNVMQQAAVDAVLFAEAKARPIRNDPEGRERVQRIMRATMLEFSQRYAEQIEAGIIQ